MERIGAYEIIAELGRGGMGAVYRARHAELGREFALKVLLPGAGESLAVLERFRREASAAGALAGHPGIVGVTDVGEADGTVYLAMELVEGRSLDVAVLEGELSAREAARLIAQAARAVEHAHIHGLLHRDLKPANIMVDAAGHARVTDFGLVNRVSADADVTRLTRSGEVVGTPSYMPPEQARSGDTDERSDVYALGATLYALLTGRPPFDGPTVYGVLTQVLKQPPKSPRRLVPGLPAALERITLKCLEKLPDDRYPSAAALAEDLERFLSGDAVIARAPSTVRRLWRGVRRHPVLTSSVAVALAAGGWLGAQAWGTAQRDAQSRVDATDTVEARETLDVATQLRETLRRLTRDTQADLALLEGAWHGSGITDDERDAALERVRAVTATIGADYTDIALPHAWKLYAEFLRAGEGAGTAPLADVVAQRPDDPFPALLLARACTSMYVALAKFPNSARAQSRIINEPYVETPQQGNLRDLITSTLHGSSAETLRDSVPESRSYLTFAAAARLLAERRFGESAMLLEELADEPAFALSALHIRGVSLYLAGEYVRAAPLLEQVCRSGWHLHWRAALQGWSAALSAPELSLEQSIGYADRMIAAGDEMVRRPELFDWGGLEARGSARRLRGDMERRRGGDPRPWHAAALEDLNAAIAMARAQRHALEHPLVARCAVHLTRARTAREQGQTPVPHIRAAIVDLDEAILLAPGSAIPMLNRASARLQEARWLFGERRDANAALAAALIDFRAARAADPTLLEAIAGEGSTHLELAFNVQRAGGNPGPHCDAAVRAYDEALRAHPENASLYAERGRARSVRATTADRFGEDAEALLNAAEADYLTQARLRPNNAESWRQLGIIASNRAQRAQQFGRDPLPHWAVAVERFRRGMETAPGDPENGRFLAQALTMTGQSRMAAGGDPTADWATANSVFENLVQRFPGHAAAREMHALLSLFRNLHHNRSGAVNLELLNEAIGHAREAVRTGPRRPRCHNILGDLLRMEGDLAGAQAAYRASLKLNANQPKIRDALAAVGG